VSYRTQSSLLRIVRRSRSAQKSKPRNGAREIFATTAAEIARETVSAVNWIVLANEKTPPNRVKTGSPQRQNHGYINSLLVG